MYTVKQLAELSGVTPRTLRYYDQIGLLKPSYINDSGYRIYEQAAVDRLQQILFYREFEFSLEMIGKLLDNAHYDPAEILADQYHELLTRREKLDRLIKDTEKVLAYYKGEIGMTDQEKFNHFKKEKIRKNETFFGEEIRQKYGEKTIDEANQKIMGMSEADLSEMQSIENELLENLRQLELDAVETSLGQEVFALHKKWLNYSWKNYSAEAHKGLADLYLEDPRFTEYYEEKAGEGKAKILKEAIYYWA